MTDAPPAAPASGSLSEVLIDAGMALLAEGGIAALTLRRAAARAGVSHAAPAHHFDGLPGLLTAIAARAFRQFSASMIAARDAAGSDPRAALSGVCAGYLAFAAGHAGLFHLMFVSHEVRRDDPGLDAAATEAYGILRAACAPFADPARPAALEIAVWSLVHGFATLGFAPGGRVGDGRTGIVAEVPAFDALLAMLLPPSA